MEYSSDYTAAIAGMALLVAVLTAAVAFVLSRPSDLPQHSR